MIRSNNDKAMVYSHFSIQYNVAANKCRKYHGKRRTESWEEFYRMTFIKVRRQLTREGGGKKRGAFKLNHRHNPAT